MQHDFSNKNPDYKANWSVGFLNAIAAFVVISLVLLSGCQKDGSYRNISQFDASAQSPLVMVIKNQANDFSAEVSEQVLKALDYTKIPYFTIDLGILTQEFDIPQTVRSLIVTTDRIQQLSDEEIEGMIEFVTRGNSILIVGPISNSRFSFLQGVKQNATFDIDSIDVGFQLNDDAFPGMKGKSYMSPGLLPHYGLLAGDFDSETKFLASTATNSAQPFIISNRIGLGEVVTINSFVVGGKIYRGILFSSILRGLQGIPYRVADVSTIFLDDFPAPLYNEKLAPIDEEYDVTHAEFVSKIWWPDMKALADSFGISYSAMTAFNYNANVVPPFDFQEWRQGSVVYNQNIVPGSIYLANDIRDTRHELAFHGYNHFSLWLEDWDNMNFMISSLQAARKRWRVDNLGALPTNYVPPTNEIDSVGIQAIVKGMPSIRYMSSLYFGDKEEGKGREFDPEPYAPAALYNYPRISSGFTMNENSLMDQHGLQLLTGIWNHFVHPDDVFQVNQRIEDEFKSRNPLGLGWKSDPEYGYGLYQLLSQRIKYTNYHYPNNRFVTATNGGRKTKDWRQGLSKYSLNGPSIKINTGFRNNYNPRFPNDPKHWYMYVTEEQSREIDITLNQQELDYSRTKIWDGYLYQFRTTTDVFFVPNFDKRFYYDRQFVNSLVRDQINNYRQSSLAGTSSEIEGNWRDTRLEDAVKAWRRNPSLSNQEQLISLSVEFNQIPRAIEILENRLLRNKIWVQDDINRLLTYYGWEGMQSRAEMFLERLWEEHRSAKVIALKNQAVAALGLFGEDFERRWRTRELQLAPDDYETLLSYTKSIESQENWPEMKENLKRLLDMRPQTDSLYAFTVQRSIYYESPDSTMELVEEFPDYSYEQLTPYASNLALMYGFEANEYEKALFWANNSPDFDEQLKLFWLAQLNLDALYLAQAKELINNNPTNDSLRSFVGTNLFYEGFYEESYSTLYPLFEQERAEGLSADTLIRNEIGFMPYKGKKDFYKRYPKFFDSDQKQALEDEYRWTESVKVSLFGEYRDDNFNNTFARGGLSVQLGNRRKNTHTLKTEYLLFSDDDSQTDLTLNYQGAGYLFAHRSDNQQFEFRAGPTVLFGESEFIPEGLIGMSFSKDSAFTSLELTGGAELTSTSLQNDYYQAQLQLYRQDYWLKNKLVSSISANTKYYTNDVLRYGGQGRLFLDLMKTKFRVRPLGEVSYSDATESFLSGIPYYTPDQYFSQGLGLDLQYRNPDNFDYRTQLTGEIMGKHERREGFFLTGRIQLEHKFRNFWQISLGSEISTSQVYRSNRIFFTISHYFPKKLRARN
ncbi:DUF2194 domain-containing protein [Gracilimonas sp.]|uniref:DUF2194 domain-containing protein n=1 Tax=Gracilimonas sp. TaxID=1974203 RepID=UPI0032EB8163